MSCAHDAETCRECKQGAAREDNDVVTFDADRHECVRPCDPNGDVSSWHKAPGLRTKRQREQASPDDPLHRDECGDRTRIADSHS